MAVLVAVILVFIVLLVAVILKRRLSAQTSPCFEFPVGCDVVIGSDVTRASYDDDFTCLLLSNGAGSILVSGGVVVGTPVG